MEKLIFIVDDSDANLTLAASILENEYRILSMPSAERMFVLLGKKIPDLILLDIEMPEMSGIEAAAKLKETPQWKEIPIIFITGWIDEKVEADAAMSGAQGIIKKPINETVLKNGVKKVLG